MPIQPKPLATYPTAANCEAPANTNRLIALVSTGVSPAARALSPKTKPKPIADKVIAKPSTRSLRREATSAGSSAWVTELMLLAYRAAALQWPWRVVLVNNGAPQTTTDGPQTN